MEYISPLQRRLPPRARFPRNAPAEVITIDEEGASNGDEVEYFIEEIPKPNDLCDESEERMCHLEGDRDATNAVGHDDKEERSTSAGVRVNYTSSASPERSKGPDRQSPETQVATKSFGEKDRSQLVTSTDIQPCIPAEAVAPPMPLSCIYLPGPPISKTFDRHRERYSRLTGNERDRRNHRQEGFSRRYESAGSSGMRRQVNRLWNNGYHNDRDTRHFRGPYVNRNLQCQPLVGNHRGHTHGEDSNERNRGSRNYPTDPRRRPEFARPFYSPTTQSYNYKDKPPTTEYNYQEGNSSQYLESPYVGYYTPPSTSSCPLRESGVTVEVSHPALQERASSISGNTLEDADQVATLNGTRISSQLDVNCNSGRGGDAEGRTPEQCKEASKAGEDEHNEDLDMREHFGSFAQQPVPSPSISHLT